MEFKFGKGPANDAGGEQEEQGQQDKGRQTTLLVLLLLLVGVVGYLYFFTDLIRPQETPTKPAPPPQVLKQPLPPKANSQALPPAKVEEPAKADVTAKAGQPVAPAPAAKPAAVPEKQTPAPAPVAKPAPAAPTAPTAPVKQPVSIAPAQPAKPPATAAAARKPETQKPVAAPAKAAEPTKPGQVAVKKEAAAKPTTVKPKTAAKENGPWILVVGSYVMEGALAEDMAKIRKAGLTPMISTGPKQPMTMHRLLYGTYDDKAEAQKAVEMLKRQTGSGFLIQKGPQHEVYAGSYSLASGAESEQKRLASGGIKVTMQKTAVPVPSRKLTAGTFTDRKAAEAALKKAKSVSAGTPVLE